MLYTINQSPFTSTNLESCLQTAPQGAPILLYEDGVYAAVPGSAVEERLRAALKHHLIYVLKSDLAARGMTRILDGLHVIGYDIFVDLVAEHNIVPWL